MTARVFLNGQWLAAEDARVSVMDRGFLFGDGIYEVIPVYSRQPFRLEQHLARLQHSLDGIQLANPYRLDEWIEPSRNSRARPSGKTVDHIRSRRADGRATTPSPRRSRLPW
jgi:branched-subunit amino acid aminotransferase/4-amino-4-deoxychorismate lyase